MGPTRPNRVSEVGRARLEPNLGTGKGGRFLVPWILLGLLAALLVALCIPSRLTDAEARLLLSLRGDGSLPPVAVPEPLLRAWFFLVGGMERPNRLLSLMGFAGTAGLLSAALQRRGSGGATALLLTLLASPGLLARTVEIGSPWAVAWIPAALLAALLGFTPLRERVAAHGGLLAALLATAILCPVRPAHFQTGLADLALAFTGSSGGLATAGAVVTALLLVIVLGRDGGWKGLSLAVLVVLAAACAEPGVWVQKPQDFFLALAWPAAALLAVSRVPYRRIDGGLLAVAALLSVLLATPNLLPHSNAAAKAARLLDWVASEPAVSPHAWVVVSGPDRHLLRWMEKTGHDTGRLSMVVADAKDLAELRRRALIFKPPQIVLFAPNDDIEQALARYRPDPRLPDVPPPTRVLVFRR